MNVPLHSYEAHRRIREDLWSADRVAANMAKQHAKIVKRHLRAEEQRRRAEAALTAGLNVAASTSAQAPRSTNTALASEQASTSTSTSISSATPSAVSRTQTIPPETKEPPVQHPQPPPPQVVDRRFVPDNMPELPWYRKIWNYQSPPTGWTADERYAHRSYIIPHPLHAAMENLQRSWMLVLNPTWKLFKATRESFSNGTQRRFWYEMWAYTRDNKQYKLVMDANRTLRQKIAEEQERQRLEEERVMSQLNGVKKDLEELERKVEETNKSEEGPQNEGEKPF